MNKIRDKLERVLKLMAPGRRRDGYAVGQPVLNQDCDPGGGPDLYSIAVVSEDFIQAWVVVSKREVREASECDLVLNLATKLVGAMASIGSLQSSALSRQPKRPGACIALDVALDVALVALAKRATASNKFDDLRLFVDRAQSIDPFSVCVKSVWADEDNFDVSREEAGMETEALVDVMWPRFLAVLDRFEQNKMAMMQL